MSGTARPDMIGTPLRGMVLAAAVILCGGCGGKSKPGHTISDVRGVGLENATQSAPSAHSELDTEIPIRTPEEIALQLERDMADLRALSGERHPDLGENQNATLGRAEPRAPEVVEFLQPNRANSESTGRIPRPAAPSSTSNATTHTSGVWDPEDPWNRGNRRPPANLDDQVDATAEVDTHAESASSPDTQLREVMVALRRELYKNASYADSPLRQYLLMAALAMADPERALDPDALHDISDREREILRAYQDFFIRIGRDLTAQGDEELLVELIDELRQNITNTGPLQIARAELCTRVDGFGKITTFDKFAFLAGSEQQVVIYTEIEGFTSVQNDSGQWVTDLWQELVIYNNHDRVPVWHDPWRAAPDSASRKRTDFFITHVITIPKLLTLGQYTLKVRIRDQKTGAIAETGVEFQIVADESLAATIPD